ncbi:hypothetical protein MXE38_04510 [Anaerobiospirillum sp. NML120448]|uniref:hypothetical protein n=1 Tax=Anaerobiospirillum sp. NML120448 TaxID=2932816 RepID=UPI001FF1582B|nr:hypothetical protein [Anaerobiospirillum sp. NML120448]MCK0514128.1 hypothetical protein [Anaerobiospirillum sp. NML120448]
MAQKTSIKLNNNWDICLDDFGNLQTCHEDAAICQDVACALRLFTNDSYYEPSKGIPYRDIVLGVTPFESLVRSELINTAKSVDGVLDADVESFTIENRALILAMQCLTVNGNVRVFDDSFDMAQGEQ